MANDNKSILAEILDAVFLNAFIFIAAFLFVRTFASFYNALASAIAFSFLIGGLVKNKNGKKKLRGKENGKMNACFEKLIFEGDDYCLDFFNGLLNKKLSCNLNGNRIELKKTSVYCMFKLEPFSAAQMLEITQKADKNRKLLILSAYGPDKKAAALADKLAVKPTFLHAEKLFGLMNAFDTYPETGVKPKKKRSFFKAFSHVFDRRLFRKYLTAAIVLCSMSYIMPYSVYYLVMGVLCAVLSFCCLFHFKKRAKKT